MSLSNTLLIDMTAAADAFGDHTATDAATSTMAIPGLAIGFAAATAFAEGGVPRASADTDALFSSGYLISGHSQELSIDFASADVSFAVSITSLSSHDAGDALSGYALTDLGSASLHGLF